MSKRTCQGCDADLSGAHGSRKWCSERCRKETLYSGRCKSCGEWTNGSNGPGTAADYCGRCAPTVHAKWSRDRIVEAMRRWRDQYGRSPGMTDWNPALAARKGLPNLDERRRRYEGGDWPCTNTVLHHFASWSEALKAAGLESNPSGWRGRWNGPTEAVAV